MSVVPVATERRLGELVTGLIVERELRGRGDTIVTGVSDDSRQVRAGHLFVALRGTDLDGRRFVDDALTRGAALVLGEGVARKDEPRCVDVPDARSTLATLARRWYDPDGAVFERLKLIGITGTNGKSTSAIMTRAILRTAGLTCGLLGTVHYDLCVRRVKARMTTPGPLELTGYLRECADAGAQAAVMEVSSHALDQKRTDALRFVAAAFTNLTGDHLDYHRTIDAYRAAKARLFAGLERDATAVVNRDDPSHVQMVADTPARVLTFGLEGRADVAATITRSTSAGTFYRLRIDGRDVVLENAIVGRHNVYNALTAAGLAHALGVSLDEIAAGLTSVRNVPGRLQRVPCESPADVFVDYAHTDDALRNVLGALKPLTRGRLIVVFGCGGDRDRSKRPRMARAVVELADIVVVTSDNPRSEEPQAIIDEILTGLDDAKRRAALVEVDRAAAIRLALGQAQADDIVLIAGKGHEDYQVLKDRRIHFDDVEVAIQAAAELSKP